MDVAQTQNKEAKWWGEGEKEGRQGWCDMQWSKKKGEEEYKFKSVRLRFNPKRGMGRQSGEMKEREREKEGQRKKVRLDTEAAARVEEIHLPQILGVIGATRVLYRQDHHESAQSTETRSQHQWW